MQPSHVTENAIVGKTLVQRGHNVYTIFPDTSKQVEKVKSFGIHVITFKAQTGDFFMDSEEYEDALAKEIFHLPHDKSRDPTTVSTNTHCKRILEDDAIVQQVRDIEPDIAIVDPFPLNYCHFLLPHNLSIPYVNIFSTSFFWDIGVPALPSFVPLIVMEASDQLTFWERVMSALYFINVNSDYSFLFEHFDNDLKQKYAPSVKSWHEFTRQTLLFFITRDEILECPFPRMPNMVACPGITYSPAKALQRDLGSLVEIATEGIILVSFGSSAGFLPDVTFAKFIQAFSTLNQYHIIWKIPSRHMEWIEMQGLPPHIHFLPWLPQNDLLGHPKTKLFLTHCGNNGQYEALYHGVPMIGFPMFAEQHHNAFRMQHKGYGIYMNIHNFSSSDLHENIVSIRTNSTIINNVLKASRMLKSRRLHPKEEIADWIEHVMQFGGSHLRSVSITMPWYQLLMLDAVLVLIAACICSFVLICSLMKLAAKCCFKNAKHKKE